MPLLELELSNEIKSIYFRYKKFGDCPLYSENNQVQYANTAKYLDLTLDVKLSWKAHIKKKKDKLETRLKKIYLANALRYLCVIKYY